MIVNNLRRSRMMDRDRRWPTYETIKRRAGERVGYVSSGKERKKGAGREWNDRQDERVEIEFTVSGRITGGARQMWFGGGEERKKEYNRSFRGDLSLNPSIRLSGRYSLSVLANERWLMATSVITEARIACYRCSIGSTVMIEPEALVICVFIYSSG